MILNGMKGVGYCFVFAAGLLAGGWVERTEAQIVTFTTPTGSSTVGSTVDGTNSAAHFDRPRSVACDADGNVYVADVTANTIRKMEVVGKDWVVTTIAGQAGVAGSQDGIGSEALFKYPCGMAVDASGNVFVADTLNHTIRKLSRSGTNWVVTTIAGMAGVPGSADGTNSNARFDQPFNNMAFDTNGNLFLTDLYNYTIRKLTPDGTNWVVTTIAGKAGVLGFVDGTNSAARFYSPCGLAIDGAGTIYVADGEGATVRKITADGSNWVVTTVAGWHLAGSQDGTNMWARFSYPEGPAVDSAGNIYVGDMRDNFTIRKVTVMGTNYVVSTVGGLAGRVGFVDGISTNARFGGPNSIAIDRQGNLYVADIGNRTIRCGWVESMASPTLEMSSSSTNVVLKWEPWASRFLVETNSSLSAGSAWGVLTNAVGILGNQFAVTNVVNGGAVFYRLRGP